MPLSYFKNPPVLLIVVIPIVLVPLLLLDTTLAMMHVWWVNETFTHGFLIFPLSLWMLWQKKDLLSQLQVRPQPVVSVLVLGALLLWLVANIVDVQVVQQFAMIMIIIFSVWLVAGWTVFYNTMFPLLFLLFAVPFGQSLIPPLMEFTADFTVALVKLSGVPIYRDGLFFTLPTGTWSVVEECSGVRYLIASTTLGCVYAYLNYSSLKKRAIFILISILLPIIGNGLRAYGIVMIGHLSGMELAVGADHLVYGWVFFGFIIFLLFFAGSFWRDSDSGVVSTTSVGVDAQPDRNGRKIIMALLTVLVMVILTSTTGSLLQQQKQKVAQIAPIDLPRSMGGWSKSDTRLSSWQPVFQSPDQVLQETYRSGGSVVKLDIGYYKSQIQGAEAVSSANRIASPLGGEWKKVEEEVIQQNGMKVKETVIRKSNNSILVWHWYRVGTFNTISPYLAKLFDAYNFIALGRRDAAMITVSTRLDQDLKSARVRLHKFMQHAADEIEKKLESAAEK